MVAYDYLISCTASIVSLSESWGTYATRKSLKCHSLIKYNYNHIIIQSIRLAMIQSLKFKSYFTTGN